MKRHIQKGQQKENQGNTKFKKENKKQNVQKAPAVELSHVHDQEVP